eukprot:scaffold174344_cov32-Tisochrysis_lutea.AAC.4
MIHDQNGKQGLAQLVQTRLNKFAAMAPRRPPQEYVKRRTSRSPMPRGPYVRMDPTPVSKCPQQDRRLLTQARRATSPL